MQKWDEREQAPAVDDDSLGTEVLENVTRLIEAELESARLKLMHHLSEAANPILKWVFVFGVALLGLGSLLESAILSLGSAWGDRYGLSALAVGLAVFLIGLPWVYWVFMKREQSL